MKSTPETIAGKMQQLRCRREIDLSAKNIGVSHVRREPGKPTVDLEAVAIPARQSMNRECVAEIMGTWADATGGRLEAGLPQQPDEIV